jgi:hypothetical protein
MSARPQEGEISLFTPEDDLLLRDGVQRLGRHWKGMLDEIEFSCPRTALELRMRYDCLKGQERIELALLLEYIHVYQPLDGVLEVDFPGETGQDAELARVRSPGGVWSDDEDAPRYAPMSPGFLAFSASRVAELARLAMGGLSRRWCEPFAATGSASNPRTGTNGPCRDPGPHRARRGGSHLSVPRAEGIHRWLARIGLSEDFD